MKPMRSMRERVSEAEWDLRVNLAACYRLVAKYGMTDLIYNHITARVPGPEHHILISAYGMLWNAVRGSHGIEPDQGRPGRQHRREARPRLFGQRRRLHHPQRRARGARGRAMRGPYAHAGRDLGLGDAGGLAAAVADGNAIPRPRCLPR